MAGRNSHSGFDDDNVNPFAVSAPRFTHPHQHPVPASVPLDQISWCFSDLISFPCGRI
jgi:hypothetical protein